MNRALKCRGVTTAADFDCDGMASLESGLFARSVDVDGILTVTGNIEAESIESDGKISSTAQISADTIRLHGMVKADEIVGDSIEICHKSPAGVAAGFLNALFGSSLRDETRNANLIEATTIRLEDVCAGVVSGEHVTIRRKLPDRPARLHGRFHDRPDEHRAPFKRRAVCARRPISARNKTIYAKPRACKAQRPRFFPFYGGFSPDHSAAL